MKVLHLIDSGGLYGAEVMLLELMSGQKRLGLEPLLCSMGNPAVGEKPLEREARARGLEVVSVRFRAGLNPFGVRRLLQIARDSRADILHSHGYKGNILAGMIPAGVRGIPLVSTLHGWTNTRRLSMLSLYEWLDRRMLRYRDAVIVVNKRMLNDRRLLDAGISPDKLHVVNNGISADAAVTEESTQDKIASFAHNGFIIGAIGRLSPEKGYGYLLEAIAQLRERGRDIRLIIVGDGPLMDTLVIKSESLGIADIVLFAGYQPDASRYLSCFNVLVLSSLSEGLPITLLEAMRAGTPLVATRVGGIPDVITDEQTGLLIEPRQAAELSAAIDRLISDPSAARLMAEAANMEFHTWYTSEKMVGEYLTIYKNVGGR